MAMYTKTGMWRIMFATTLFAICSICGYAQPQPVKAAVVTGGHGFDADAFAALFKDQPGITFVVEEQKDHSELFENISDFPYDVIVFYSMTQQISEKRRRGFIRCNQGCYRIKVVRYDF